MIRNYSLKHQSCRLRNGLVVGVVVLLIVDRGTPTFAVQSQSEALVGLKRVAISVEVTDKTEPPSPVLNVTLAESVIKRVLDDAGGLTIVSQEEAEKGLAAALSLSFKRSVEGSQSTLHCELVLREKLPLERAGRRLVIVSLYDDERIVRDRLYGNAVADRANLIESVRRCLGQFVRDYERVNEK